MTSYHSFAKGRSDLMPRDSYWTRPELQRSREAFYAYIREEQERIRLSYFGATVGLGAYAPIDPEQESRWRKARQERMDETRRGLTEGAA